MRLAGHTYSFRAVPLEQALDRIAEVGFERVELWAGHAPEGPAGVARALERSGLEVAAVSIGGVYDSRLAGAVDGFALARAVGAPVVVTCAPPGLLRALARTAPPDLALCVENHWDQPLARPAEVLRALRSEPGVAACLDTGHSLVAGVDPVRFAVALGPRLGHVHLKDARRTPLPELLLGRSFRRRHLRPAPVPPGSGGLDVQALLAALAVSGFAGTVTLEHEGGHAEAALAALLELARTGPGATAPCA